MKICHCGLVALNVTIKLYSTIVKFWEHMIIMLLGSLLYVVYPLT